MDRTTTLPRKSLSFIGWPSRSTPSISGAGLPTESRCSSSRWTLATAGRSPANWPRIMRRPLGATVVVGDEGELGDHPVVEPCGPVLQGLRVLLEDPIEVPRAEPLAHRADPGRGAGTPRTAGTAPDPEDLRQPVAGQAADLAVRVLLRGVVQEVLDALGGPVELELPVQDLLDPIAPRVVPGQDLPGLAESDPKTLIVDEHNERPLGGARPRVTLRQLQQLALDPLKLRHVGLHLGLLLGGAHLSLGGPPIRFESVLVLPQQGVELVIGRLAGIRRAWAAPGCSGGWPFA